MKYGLPGGEIKIGAIRKQNGFQLEVFNQGQGPAPEKIAKLFEKFVRLNGGQGRMDRKGTGLGLFITKEIVGKHGG